MKRSSRGSRFHPQNRISSAPAQYRLVVKTPCGGGDRYPLSEVHMMIEVVGGG